MQYYQFIGALYLHSFIILYKLQFLFYVDFVYLGYDQEELENIRNASAKVMLNDLRQAVHENDIDLNIQGSHGETVVSFGLNFF